MGVLLVGALVLRVLPIGRGKQRAGEDDEVRRPTNTSVWRRLWWSIRPPADVMRVDGLVIDRTRKLHCGWLGPTGAGKTSALVVSRMDGRRPMLLVTPDLSDPIIQQLTLLPRTFRWTACESTRAVDFLIGTPQEVAERLTEVFRSGGVGAWKRAARRATARVIEGLDGAGLPRSLQVIGAGLQAAIKEDRDLRVACVGWVERFLDLADQFGGSIAEGGVDIADLLRQGYTVLLDNDAFEHPALKEDVVALGLAEAKRCASRVPGGFRLVFEEAGQLGERLDLAEPFFRAGRRRRIPVDVLTQAESDLRFHGNDGITSNIATRVYFAQELKSLQQQAADRLGCDYRELDPSRMRDFTAWIAHGRIRRLVRFPKPQKGRLSTTDTVECEKRTGKNGQVRRVEVIELRREELLGLPPPSQAEVDLMANIYREGECERWSGKHDRAGHEQACKAGCTTRHQHRGGCPADCAIQAHLDNCYGLVWWPLAEPTETRTHEWQRVHRVRWRLAYGPIPLDPKTGKPMTVDHRRTCPKDCSKLEHLNGLATRGENSKRRWRVRGVGSAAD